MSNRRVVSVSGLIGPASRGTLLTQLPAIPADMRVGNLLRVLNEMRGEAPFSRSELARVTGLGVPTVHRLIVELLALDLITEHAPRQDVSIKGRPASTYQLQNHGVVVVGVDIGNRTTRWAIASASGRILTSSQKETECIRRRLVDGIADEVEALLGKLGIGPGKLAGLGVGVSAVVDPRSGRLLDPPCHANWQGLDLGNLIRERLGCRTTVHQDNHFAAVAEASSVGTFPSARSLVVLEIGEGIGVAMMVDGVTLTGANGRFGRIAGWPVSVARRGFARSTLGTSLVAGGLVEDYHRRNGDNRVVDGSSLFAAAASGDIVATAVVAWAAEEIAELVVRLQRLFDPVGIVLGGGLARGFATLEPHLRPHLPMNVVLAPSSLGDNAVVVGAILSSLGDVEAWLTQRLGHLHADRPAPRSLAASVRRS